MRDSEHHYVGRLLFICLLTITSALPSIVAESLLTQLSAQRTDEGGIIFIGQVKLPKGTRMMVDLCLHDKILGQDKITLGDGGELRSAVFTNGGKPYSSGNYQIKVYSYFTKVWQPLEILKLVGENGALLPSTLLVPDDSEFPNASRHFEETINIQFPSITPASSKPSNIKNNQQNSITSNVITEQQAIQSVQEAYLSIPNSGRSADSVKGVIAFFEEGGGFKALSWTASQSSQGVWVITLSCIDAGQNKKAQWEYNSKTKTAKYLDPLAKLLSWTPSK